MGRHDLRLYLAAGGRRGLGMGQEAEGFSVQAGVGQGDGPARIGPADHSDQIRNSPLGVRGEQRCSLLYVKARRSILSAVRPARHFSLPLRDVPRYMDNEQKDLTQAAAPAPRLLQTNERSRRCIYPR